MSSSLLTRDGLIDANASTRLPIIFVKEVLTLPPVNDADGTPTPRLVDGTETWLLLDSAIAGATITFTDLYAASSLRKIHLIPKEDVFP